MCEMDTSLSFFGWQAASKESKPPDYRVETTKLHAEDDSSVRSTGPMMLASLLYPLWSPLRSLVTALLRVQACGA